MTVTEFLHAEVPFLSGLSQEQAHALASQAEQKRFGAGSTILFAGTTVDGLCVVASGKVAVWVKPSKGKTAVKAAELGPGEVFGETSIIEMGTAGATIKAAEDETLIFVIPQGAFQEVLQDPQFKSRAVELIASRKKQNLGLVAA